MKTNRIAIALLASVALMLSACERETEIEIRDAHDGVVSFKMADGQTRSAVEGSFVGSSRELGSVTMEDGSVYYLHETVTSLDDDYSFTPETRGTPAFTKNVEALYTSFYTVAKVGATTTDAFNHKDAEFKYDQTSKFWTHKYGENIWKYQEMSPAQSVTYYMRMPGTADGVSNLTYEGGVIKFDYTSPSSASAQKDILYTSHERTTKTNEEEITFYHALTGVKFANFFDNPNLATKTIIKKVEISGLYTSGKCTVTPANGASATSKKSAAASKWTDLKVEASPIVFSQTFDPTFADYTQGVGGKNIDLSDLNANAAKKNLNDNNGSLTFFFIPQQLDEDVTIKVTFDIEVNGTKTYENQELEVPLGNMKWEAGELHTYTLKPSKVKIIITDEVDGIVKSDVVITNKGNVDEYVRATIVAYWAAPDGSIISGFSDTETVTDDLGTTVYGKTEFPQWALAADGKSANYGTFTGLPGSKWVYDSTDGFYYCTEAVGPNMPTATLFTKYECENEDVFTIKYLEEKNNVKRLVVNTPAVKAHVVMDIIVQAIEKQGSESYTDAWARAKASATPIED